MERENDQFYDLLTAVIQAQTEFQKRILSTKENMRLLLKRNKHLPNRTSPLKLVMSNLIGYADILLDRIKKESKD